MEMFTKTNKSKKLILVLVLLMLFNFCCPRNVVKADEDTESETQSTGSISIGDISKTDNQTEYSYTATSTGDTGGWFDLSTNFASLLFFMERGVFGLINNIFSDSEHKFEYTIDEKRGYKEIDIKIFLTPESIIKGKYLLFNADIFDDVSDGKDYYDDGDGKRTEDGRTKLRNTISGWYTALRTFSIVALLSVLVYVGIRMVISTIAQDKAKYKVMFKDWLVALCLLIVMHYIMIAILDISSLIVEAVGTSGAAASQTEQVMEKIGNITASRPEYTVEYNGKKTEGVKAIYTDIDNNLELYTIGDAYAYEFLLVAILFYTILFAIKYLKREFTIMFLILLGPISCITYPIDKISDGKAQAFNKWFSEFLYQVIIQPFHLLIYIVLVGTATDLANDNLLYSIVCFAVMIPAEKFIKEMFGFRDKLGSPLGAMATGAAASQIFNKLKGGSSGGSKSSNSGDNDSTPNTLPPKTVDDKKDLVAGEGSNSPRIGVRDNTPSGDNAIGDGTENMPTEQTLEAAGDVATAAVATDAIDEATDNGANGDQSTLDEQMNDAQEQQNTQRQIDGALEDNQDNQKNADKDGQEEGNTNLGIDDKQSKWERIKNSKPVGFVKNKGQQALNIHNQRMAKKWGSTSRGKRWVNRGKNTAKFLAKTGVGLLAGGVAVMAGKGAQGFAAGMVGGYALTGKAMDSVSNVASDYIGGMRSDKGREKHAFNEFRGNSKQIDKAVMSYRENHDGEDPNRKQLDQEMEDRFELSRYNLSDDQIDDVIGVYQDKKQELMDAGRTEDDAKRIAASQAKYTSQLSGAYSAKDFRDDKVMEKAYNRITEGLMKDTGCGEKVARENAEKYLTNAAKIKGVSASELNLPSTTKTLDVPVERQAQNVAVELGIEGMSDFGDEQIERMNNLTIRLRDMGYKKDEITIIAKQSSDSKMSTVGVLDKYEANIKYLSDENAQEQAKIQLESVNRGKTATKEQLRDEMKERLILKSTFNVKDEGDVSALRDLEHKEIKEKTQVQMAREFAILHKGELQNTDKMNEAREKLVLDLVKGGSSNQKAQKDAQNIMNLAGQYEGVSMKDVSTKGPKNTKTTKAPKKKE